MQLHFFLFLILAVFSCNEGNTTHTKNKNKVLAVKDTVSTKKLRKRKVAVKKQNDSTIFKNNLNYSFDLFTKDTIIQNIFTGENIDVELIKHLHINLDNKLSQVISNVNETALFYPDDNKVVQLELKDKNNDGFLDLWLEFSPESRLYDSDCIIYCYNPQKNFFSKEKEYLLKNLTQIELQQFFDSLSSDAVN